MIITNIFDVQQMLEENGIYCKIISIRLHACELISYFSNILINHSSTMKIQLNCKKLLIGFQV